MCFNLSTPVDDRKSHHCGTFLELFSYPTLAPTCCCNSKLSAILVLLAPLKTTSLSVLLFSILRALSLGIQHAVGANSPGDNILYTGCCIPTERRGNPPPPPQRMDLLVCARYCCRIPEGNPHAHTTSLQRYHTVTNDDRTTSIYSQSVSRCHDCSRILLGGLSIIMKKGYGCDENGFAPRAYRLYYCWKHTAVKC